MITELGSSPCQNSTFVYSFQFFQSVVMGSIPSTCPARKIAPASASLCVGRGKFCRPRLPNNGNLPSDYGRTSPPAKTMFTCEPINLCLTVSLCRHAKFQYAHLGWVGILNYVIGGKFGSQESLFEYKKEILPFLVLIFEKNVASYDLPNSAYSLVTGANWPRGQTTTPDY